MANQLVFVRMAQFYDTLTLEQKARVGYSVNPNDFCSLFTSTRRKGTLRQILQWSFARVIQF